MGSIFQSKPFLEQEAMSFLIGVSIQTMRFRQCEFGIKNEIKNYDCCMRVDFAGGLILLYPESFIAFLENAGFMRSEMFVRQPHNGPVLATSRRASGQAISNRLISKEASPLETETPSTTFTESSSTTDGKISLELKIPAAGDHSWHSGDTIPISGTVNVRDPGSRTVMLTGSIRNPNAPVIINACPRVPTVDCKTLQLSPVEQNNWQIRFEIPGDIIGPVTFDVTSTGGGDIQRFTKTLSND